MKALWILVSATTLLLSGCKKDKKEPDEEPVPVPSTNTATVKLFFQDVVDNENLEFNKKYLNQNGDTFTVNKFNYYISNIVLVKEDNGTWAETSSYHLIKHSGSSSDNYIDLNGVPPGNYKDIRFMLGVDSTRNVSGAQTGDLDPAKVGDMFWSWNTGYIFLKLEGTAPKSPAVNKSIVYHIGGYGGTNKAQRNFSFSFGTSPVLAKTNVNAVVQFKVNVNELFKTPNTISFAATNGYNVTSAGATVRLYADNYADMISLSAVINP